MAAGLGDGLAAREQSGGGTDSISERRWRLLGATAIGAFIAPFDGSVVAIALPKIGPALHLSFVGALWVQLSYLLVLTAALIPAGRLADTSGGLRLYRIGLVVFALASAAAGASTSTAWLLAARCTQGIGAALLSATSTALVTEAFPGRTRQGARSQRHGGVPRTRAGAGTRWAPHRTGRLAIDLLCQRPCRSSKPRVGLAADQSASYRAPSGRGRLGPAGGGTARRRAGGRDGGGQPCPDLGLDRCSFARSYGGGVGGLIGLVAYESRRSEPFLDVGLFRRSRLYATANFAALASYIAFSAVTVLTSVFLEVVSGRSPEQAGLLLVAAPAAMVALSWLAGGHRTWLAHAGSPVEAWPSSVPA